MNGQGNHQRAGCIVSLACFTLLVGCRMGVPIHVWQPPSLQSTVGHSVIVPPVAGWETLATPLHEQLIGAAPNDSGRQTDLVASDQAIAAAAQRTTGNIARVSYEQQDDSDLALFSAARSAEFDFVLRGEVLSLRRSGKPVDADNQLVVSWLLMPVNRSTAAAAPEQPGGRPVVVELESAIERYPDLEFASDQRVALETALVRDTLAMLTPSVSRDRVQLEIPYLLPGSRLIRRGNAMAKAGRWGEAETIWRQARKRYPYSSVAVHNLAIAAVAKQDFSTARNLARWAVRMKSTKLHRKTLVWVEQVQRAYHKAFGLPDPQEGWSVTRAERGG